MLEANLREQNRQITALLNADRTPVAPPAPPPTVEEERQEFYNNPKKETRALIREELQAAIGPLNEFVRGLRVDGSPYVVMLNRFRADARFAATLQDPQVLAAVEKIMGATELTEINMQSAIVHASGLKNMGLLDTVVPAPSAPAPAPSSSPTPAPAPTVTLPAHVRPSAPAAPRNDGGNGKIVRPPLSENARRVMREQGFKNEEEYWAWMDLPPGDVANSDIGRPKPAGK